MPPAFWPQILGWTMAEWISVIPPIGPRLPLHPGLGEPSIKYPYLNADGSRSWAIFRWGLPSGEKEIRPLTLWRGDNGVLKWEWKFPPGLRSLFNLDQLQARPGVPVLIVEGEKTALAAASLFPEFVIITSGSSTSAGSVDWRPLQGRCVILWPDADEPGRKYAKAVNKALQGIASSVVIISIPSGFPSGWDLADAPPHGWTTAKLHQLVQDTGPVITHGEKAAKDEPLLILRGSDLLKAEIQPRRWLLQGWLPRCQAGALGAMSDHGKTFLAIQLAAALASARPLFGVPTVTEPLGTLYVTFEDTQVEELQPRIQAVLDAQGLRDCEYQEVANRIWFAVPNYAGGASNFGMMGLEQCIDSHLLKMSQDRITPGLVVIDTFNAVGLDGEAKPEVAAQIWGVARRICATHDVSVLFIHHVRKEGQTGKYKNILVERVHPSLLRGSSANEGAARFILMLGWITPAEAESAGLNPDKAMNLGYAFLRASKLKATRPEMLFISRIEPGQPGAGCWAVHPDSSGMMAKLQSSARKLADLDLQDQVLLALADKLDDATIQAKVFEDDPKGSEKLKRTLSNLKNKSGQVQNGRSRDLTVAGFNRVQYLRQQAASLPEVFQESEGWRGSEGRNSSQSLPEEVDSPTHGRKVFSSSVPRVGSVEEFAGVDDAGVIL